MKHNTRRTECTATLLEHLLTKQSGVEAVNKLFTRFDMQIKHYINGEKYKTAPNTRSRSNDNN